MSIHSSNIAERRKENYNDYQQEAAKRLLMYEGDYLEDLMNFIYTKVDPSAWNLVLKNAYDWNLVENLMKDVIDRTTKVYTNPAKREFIIDNEFIDEKSGETIIKTDDVYDDVKNSFNYDGVIDQVLKYMLCTGGAIVRPYVDDSDRIKTQILTPDIFIPILSIDDPTKLVGVEYLIPNTDNQQGVLDSYFIWDMEGYRLQEELRTDEPTIGMIEKRGTDIVKSILNEEYPYKDSNGDPLLPFALCRMDVLPFRFLNQNTGKDLYDGTIIAGKILVQLLWQLSQQSHKQVVLIGSGVDDISGKISYPAFATTFSRKDAGELDIQILDLSSDTSPLKDQIDKIYERVLTRRGLSLSDFQATAQKSTAEALQIERLGQIEYNKNLQSIMLDTERQFAEILRVVWNTDGSGSKINNKAEFYINFANPLQPNVLADIETKLGLVDKNYLSPVDIIQQLEPDIKNEKDAIAKILHNKELKRKIGGFTSQNVNAIIDSVPEPNAQEAFEEEVVEPEQEIAENIEDLEVTV